MGGPLTSEATIIVQVLDVNDNNPVFTMPPGNPPAPLAIALAEGLASENAPVRNIYRTYIRT